MKKLLIVTLLVIAGFSSRGDVKQVVSDIKSTADTMMMNADTALHQADTSKLSHKIYADVKSALTGLASGLKVGAEHVYAVLVKQSIVDAITYLLIGVIGFLIVLSWFRSYKSSEKWVAGEDGDFVDDGPTMLGVVRIIQGVIGIVMFLIMMFNISTVVMGFVNPEFGAIQTILDFAKKL